MTFSEIGVITTKVMVLELFWQRLLLDNYFNDGL